MEAGKQSRAAAGAATAPVCPEETTPERLQLGYVMRFADRVLDFPGGSACFMIIMRPH
jgi:hypothetical protein